MYGDSLASALRFYYGLTPEDDIGWSMIQGVYDKVYNKAESVSVDELVSVVRQFLSMHASGYFDFFVDSLDGIAACIRGTLADGAQNECGDSPVSIVWNALCRRCGGVDEARNLIFSNFPEPVGQFVINDARLEALCVCDAVLCGDMIDHTERSTVCCCHSKRKRNELSVQLQAKYKDWLKCVHLVLRQDGNDVVARADWAAYTSPNQCIGYDFDSEYSWAHDDHKVHVATEEDLQGYGFAWLRYSECKLSFPCSMPVVVYKYGKPGPWCPSGCMGNTGALAVDADFRDPADSSHCLKVSYTAGGNWAGLCWQDPSGDWGERPGGQNLSNANTLFFRARGEIGGEVVSFGIGGIMDKMVSDTADRVLPDVVLTKEWKTYRIDLGDLDLSRIKTGFRLWVKGQGKTIAFYVDHVFYDHVDDSTLPGISRNSMASLLERAEIGDRVAMYELGVRWENGHEHRPDLRAAKRWYLKAASRGERRAADALRRLMGL